MYDDSTTNYFTMIPHRVHMRNADSYSPHLIFVSSEIGRLGINTCRSRRGLLVITPLSIYLFH